MSDRLTAYSISSLGVLAERVIPGKVPVVNKLFHLHTVSVEPVFVLPYCSAWFLFVYLIHN